MPTLPKIKFTAPAGSFVGSIVRIQTRGYKFWKITKIVNGKASATALPREAEEGCC